MPHLTGKFAAPPPPPTVIPPLLLIYHSAQFLRSIFRVLSPVGNPKYACVSRLERSESTLVHDHVEYASGWLEPPLMTTCLVNILAGHSIFVVLK